MKTIYYTLALLTVLISLTLTSCSIDELETKTPSQDQLNKINFEEEIINENLFKRDSTETNKDGDIDPVVKPPKKD